MARELRCDDITMQATAEHTGLSVRDAANWERVLRGGEGDGGRSQLGADRRGGESRVVPFAGRDRLATRVGDLAMRPIPVVPSHVTMLAARKVAALKRISLLLVERSDQLVGIVDERALATATDATSVSGAMRPFGTCLDPGMSVAQARDVFVCTRAAVLPVIVGGFVLGAVARGDIENAKTVPRL